MRIEVSEEPTTALEDYAGIPIAFEVGTVLDVTEKGSDHCEFVLMERVLDIPYMKDYDAVDGEGPLHWASRFDMSGWGLFTARVDSRRVGGAAVVFKTPGLDMLEGREDLAVLWDIRVSPEARGHGVGSALFRAAEAWVRDRGCRQLKVETQNINVRACKFYMRQGCVLMTANHSAYPELPDETQLLWYKDLS